MSKKRQRIDDDHDNDDAKKVCANLMVQLLNSVRIGDHGLIGCLLKRLSGAELNAFGFSTRGRKANILFLALVLRTDERGVAILLQLLADTRILVNCTRPSDGLSPLHLAVSLMHWHRENGCGAHRGDDGNDNYHSSGQFLKAMLRARIDDIDVNVRRQSDGYTPLHLAVQLRCLGAARVLLAHRRCNVNELDDTLSSALHCAVAVDCVDAIQMLLTADGCNVNARRAPDGHAPLHLAVSGAHAEATRLLLAHERCNANCTDSAGFTPLHCATAAQFADGVRMLLERGGSDVDLDAATGELGATALHLAARLGDARIARMLLEAGADVNAAAVDGATATIVASMMGAASVLVALLRAPAMDVNARQHVVGLTALMHAVAQSDERCVALLVGADQVDVNALPPNGDGALHLAARNRSGAGMRMLELLLAVDGVDVNAARAHGESRGTSPLHAAAIAGNVAAVQRLCRAPGIDANAVAGNSGDGHYTPLNVAARLGLVDAVRALLAADSVDADRRVRGDDLTPLMSAAERGHANVVSLLLAYRPPVDVNARASGLTSLHVAIANGHFDAAATLLNARSVEPNALDYGDGGGDGHAVRTPLGIAADAQQVELFKLLAEQQAVRDFFVQRIHSGGAPPNALKRMQVMCVDRVHASANRLVKSLMELCLCVAERERLDCGSAHVPQPSVVLSRRRRRERLASLPLDSAELERFALGTAQTFMHVAMLFFLQHLVGEHVHFQF
jgi:ankyrin repeat protein